MASPSPFHVGEQRVQERLGVRDVIEPWARKIVRPFLPEEHRIFYAGLPYLVVAARDAAGRPWVTLLAGEPGFARSPDARHLDVGAAPSPGDALAGAFVEGADVGVLGIELSTRRRNRVNGTVARVAGDGFRLAVSQSFGNCPQYIHAREWERAEAAPEPPRASDALDAAQRAWIEAADTFFVASGHGGAAEDPAHGMDASHRGGEPGFVRVLDERTLAFPDYAGNKHFNTIGNWLLDPRGGLLFVDFAGGHLLQLTGRVTIDWAPDTGRFPGAQRLVRFALEEARELRSALPLRFGAGGALRSLRVVEKRRESDDVTSFVFEARDGGDLEPFAPGQHLPLEVALPGREHRVPRSYSLSGPPDAGRYRISVKREPHGLVSRHLHDAVDVGEILSAGAPSGDFTFSCGGRPAVLVAGGVGVTPLLSMLHVRVAAGGDCPLWFVHGVRDGRHHPLAGELRALAAADPAVRLHVSYSRPRAEDVAGRDYDRAGRVDGALLASLLPDLDADFYLCGPPGFLAALRGDLEARGVATERIRHETFGPSA